MPDHPTPAGFSWEPGPDRTPARHDERTAVTTHGETSITWYTTTPVTLPPGPPPPPPGCGMLPPGRPQGGGGRRRHLGRTLAVVALAVALLLSGVAVARHFATSGVSTTSLTQPFAPDSAQQQAPGQGDGSGAQPQGSGSGGATATTDVSAAAAKITPAIVNITVSNDYTASGGAATGIVLTSDGYVLTNNHVVNGSTDIQATDLGNGQTYSATVVGYDATHDIALIKLDGASGLATASIGDSSSLAVGDTVVGVGNAGGDGGEPTVAAGSVVALDQQIVANDQADGTAEQLSGLIQTDANIQSGDSGGPLVDADGAVIGVMTAASASNGSSGYGGGYGYGEGYGSTGNEGYAVPIATAMQIADQIKSGEGSDTVHIGETGFLGVQTTDASSQGSSGSADPYGYGGGYADPYGYSDPYGYGYGDGSGGQSGSSGSATGSGATVAGVVSGSPAEAAGLTAGDVITAVDGEAVTSSEDLGALIGAHHPGDTVKVSWTDSSGASRSADVELTAGPAK